MHAPSQSWRRKSRRLLALLSFGVMAGVSQPAFGSLYWANSDQVLMGESEDSHTVAEAKFRLSYANWDQSLSNSAGTIATSNGNSFLSSNLVGYGTGYSNLTVASQFSFVFEHRINEGFVFTMTDLANPANVSTLAWGTDFSSLPGTVKSAATLPTASSPGIAPTGSFNTLAINLQDSRNKPGTAMSFSNLSFKATDSLGNALLLADGGLQTSETALYGANSLLSQSIVANIDLSKSNWALSGTLAGTRDNSTGGDESVKFYVDVYQSHFNIEGGVVAAPEPATFVALALLGILSSLGSVISRTRTKKYLALFQPSSEADRSDRLQPAGRPSRSAGESASKAV